MCDDHYISDATQLNRVRDEVLISQSMHDLRQDSIRCSRYVVTHSGLASPYKVSKEEIMYRRGRNTVKAWMISGKTSFQGIEFLFRL